MRGSDLDLDQQYPSRKKPSEALGFSSGQPDTPVGIKESLLGSINYNTFPAPITGFGGQKILGQNKHRKFIMLKNSSGSNGRFVAISFGRNIFGNVVRQSDSEVQLLGAYMLEVGQELKIENHAATNEIWATILFTSCGAEPQQIILSVTEGIAYAPEK